MALKDLKVISEVPFPDERPFGQGKEGRQRDGEQVSDKSEAEATDRTGAEQLPFLALNDDTAATIQSDTENGAQAPKFGPRVSEADTAIGVINAVAERAYGDAEARFSLGLPEVQAALYCAIVDLEQRGQVDEFLVEREVPRHGNAKNPYARVLAGFTNGKHPRVRQTLAKAAAVMALARADSIEPQKFRTWRKDWPIEEACREWRARQKRIQGGEPKTDAVDFYLTSDAEFLPPVRPTVGYAGRQLAVIECAPDLSGCFRVVRVLSCDDGTLRRTVLSAMRKKAESKGGRN
jgi:hypothetical protein